jgi:hypothetical protein
MYRTQLWNLSEGCVWCEQAGIELVSMTVDEYESSESCL